MRNAISGSYFAVKSELMAENWVKLPFFTTTLFFDPHVRKYLRHGVTQINHSISLRRVSSEGELWRFKLGEVEVAHLLYVKITLVKNQYKKHIYGDTHQSSMMVAILWLIWNQ